MARIRDGFMVEPVMEGCGYYNQHSELQARSAAEADAVLERPLASVTIPPGPLTIADFGSSQGQNSLRQVALALDRLTERTGQSRDVMVVHTDLPHCDFTSLFVLLETALESYMCGRDHVFGSAIGHFFYDRLLPAGSLTFGWPAFALHWLSTLPLTLRAHIWPVLAASGEAKAFGGTCSGGLAKLPRTPRRRAGARRSARAGDRRHKQGGCDRPRAYDGGGERGVENTGRRGQAERRRLYYHDNSSVAASTQRVRDAIREWRIAERLVCAPGWPAAVHEK
jgi:SAM dependent carboxyl methyltransferase